MASMQI